MRQALIALTAVGLLAGCGGGEEPAGAAEGTAAPSTSAVVSGVCDDYAPWPPPLPPQVSTEGEAAWRATWAPEPGAEEQYLADLRSGASVGQAFTDEELIGAGCAVCSFYYDGTSSAAVSEAMFTAGKYDPLQIVTIGLAAEQHFCGNFPIDW